MNQCLVFFHIFVKIESMLKYKLNCTEAIYFCEEALSYFLDKGYYINTKESKNMLDIFINKDSDREIIWEEVKDDILTFLIRLNYEYYLSSSKGKSIKILSIIKEIERSEDLYYFSNMRMSNIGDTHTMSIKKLEKTKIFKKTNIKTISFTIKSKRY